MRIRKPTLADVVWLALPAAMFGMVVHLLRMGPNWFLPPVAVLCVMLAGSVRHFVAAEGRSSERIRDGIAFGNGITMTCVAVAILASTSAPQGGAPFGLGILAAASGAVVLTWAGWSAFVGERPARRR